MKILIASDKFKGSLTGAEACAAIEKGIHSVFPKGNSSGLETCGIPIADGGEGMARSITAARGGEWREISVSDPLGRPVVAGYGWIEAERVAVIEMAEASGLWRMAERERDPWRASTFGTGELIRDAREKGARKILLGIGGSATNDGGCGMARAVGFRFLDSKGEEVSDLPADLDRASTILPPTGSEIPAIEVACDVDNPLLGAEGCTRIYGPQKGIVAEDFQRHEDRLKHLIHLIGERGSTLAETPGAGAAGGLGFGALAFLDANLRPGFDLVAEAIGLEEAIVDADVVVTGEGKLDRQTLHGKGPAALADLARRHGKPVVAFGGTVEPDARADLAKRFDLVLEINPGNLPISESIARAAELLTAAAAENGTGIVALARSEGG